MFLQFEGAFRVRLGRFQVTFPACFYAVLFAFSRWIRKHVCRVAGFHSRIPLVLRLWTCLRRKQALVYLVEEFQFPPRDSQSSGCLGGSQEPQQSKKSNISINIA